MTLVSIWLGTRPSSDLPHECHEIEDPDSFELDRVTPGLNSNPNLLFGNLQKCVDECNPMISLKSGTPQIVPGQQRLRELAIHVAVDCMLH